MRIAPITGKAKLVVNEFGLHAQAGNVAVMVDGFTADSFEVYRHSRHRSGMNDEFFTQTRIQPFQEIIDNTVIKFYER